MTPQPSLSLHWQAQLADYITAVAWSPADHRFAAASAAGEVVYWRGEEFIYLQAAQNCSIDCLDYSADGKYLAAGGQLGQLLIWSEQQLVAALDYPRNWIDHLVWHPSQPLLAFSTGKKVQIWNAQQEKIVATLNFDRSSVCDLAWQPQGDFLAIAGYQGVEVWQWPGDESERLVVDTSVHGVAWSLDGQYLAAATLDRQMSIARIGELEMPWVMRGFPSKIRQMGWDSDGLVVLSGEQLVRWLYSEEDWQAHTTDYTNICQFAIQGQDSYLSMVANSGQVILTTNDFQKLFTVNLSGEICTAMAWSKNGRSLCVGNKVGLLSLLEM